MFNNQSGYFQPLVQQMKKGQGVGGGSSYRKGHPPSFHLFSIRRFFSLSPSLFSSSPSSPGRNTIADYFQTEIRFNASSRKVRHFYPHRVTVATSMN
ncbi:hypothetical protein CDAR_84151 [Caerostris darwini]|uniref:Uncharacterized protein n=1 Tax=Caerostris darwini TaxID=1538125 RepID=A0AAV4U6L7_9ARAC|nr:hypothetical protein CDAR_84151 [Caerostris darwini]